MCPTVLSTTIGDLPLEEYRLELAGRGFGVLHTGAILSEEDEQRFLGAELRVPYGLALWPAAVALAHEVATRALEGRRVLELGAGTGLPGIVAAARGADVVLTDRHDVALFVARKNAERNAVTVRDRVADWTSWDDGARYDLILGADVLYGQSVHGALRRIFAQNLAPGGAVLLGDPFRKLGLAFLEAMEGDGWRVTASKWSVGAAGSERAVGVFEATRG